MDLLYRVSNEYEPPVLVVAPRANAERAARLWNAIDAAKTWGDFKDAVNPDDWADLERMRAESASDDEDLEPLNLEDPFTTDELPGHYDGLYPEPMTSLAATWFPQELTEEYDAYVFNPFGEHWLRLPAERTDEILADLEGRGYSVSRSELNFR